MTLSGRGLSFSNAGGMTAATGSQLLGVRVTGVTGAAVTAAGSYLLVQDSEIVDNTGIGIVYGLSASGAVGAGVEDTHGNRIAGNGGNGISVGPAPGPSTSATTRSAVNAAGDGAQGNGGWGVSVATAGTTIFDNLISGNGDGGITVNDCVGTENT